MGYLIVFSLYFLIGLLVVSFIKQGEFISNYLGFVSSTINWIWKILWFCVQGVFKILWYLLTQLFNLLTLGYVQKKQRPF